MQALISRFLLILTAVALTGSVALADDLDSLAGKWTLTRKNDDGQTVVHKLHFKEGKFTFRMMTEGGSTLLYAEGDATVATAGGIKVAHLTNIRAGESDADLQAIGEDYSAAFRVSGTTCYFANGLDRERAEAPRMDVYKKE